MVNYRENGGILLTPDTYIKSCWKLGLELGLSENGLAQAMAEFLAERNQNAEKPVVVAFDPRVEHILATLKAKLGISMDLNDLPPIPVNPDVEKFPNLVLVLGKTTLNELVGANGIASYINLQKVRNANGVTTPKGNYWLWMQGGKLYKGKSVNDAARLFAKNERGGTCKEGLFQYMYYSELLNECFMDFAGSRCARSAVPYLSRWYDELRLNASPPGTVASAYGSVSVGVSLVP